jgi:hypothetical protein
MSCRLLRHRGLRGNPDKKHLIEWTIFGDYLDRICQEKAYIRMKFNQTRIRYTAQEKKLQIYFETLLQKCENIFAGV